MSDKISKCCSAYIKVCGDTTKYYVCTRCNDACDVKEKTLEKEFSYYEIQSLRENLLNNQS